MAAVSVVAITAIVSIIPVIVAVPMVTTLEVLFPGSTPVVAIPTMVAVTGFEMASTASTATFFTLRRSLARTFRLGLGRGFFICGFYIAIFVLGVLVVQMELVCVGYRLVFCLKSHPRIALLNWD